MSLYDDVRAIYEEMADHVRPNMDWLSVVYAKLGQALRQEELRREARAETASRLCERLGFIREGDAC